VKATGIHQVTRPVLPMVMRGVPVSLAKGLYIFRDTRREGAALGMPFGHMIDPIGTPVRRAFSLWPWARGLGKGEALIASFLRAAFSEAIDTSVDAGLRKVVERAGLDWSQALSHLGSTEWQQEVEDNRLCMVNELGQWGVPSFRLRGPGGEPDLVAWGQDRLWLISREIQRRGALG
jgi:2-hydroxychromene-2-carboxylate isomerase